MITIRKVFSDNLPRWGNGNINWDEVSKSKVKIKFVYKKIEGEVQVVDYDGVYLHIKYLDRDVYKIATNGFLKCQLGTLLGKVTGSFKVEIGDCFKDQNRDVFVTDREYRIDRDGFRRKWYKLHCNTCGWEDGWKIESSLIKSNKGCPVCSCNPRIVVEGINDIPTTAPWMVRFFKGGYSEAKLYTKGSGVKIQPKCPDCNTIRNKAMAIVNIYTARSINCLCGDGISYPEKLMYSLLKQLNINFEYQYSPHWIAPKKYDFYFEIDNRKYIVEMDGALGHGKKVIKGGLTKKETLDIDIYKDEMAYKNNIEMIRINCDRAEINYIKNNIIASSLNHILQIERKNIDWDRIDKLSTSNICREVCQMKHDNPSLTSTQICEIVGLGSTAILNYLNKGAKFGWCNYNGRDEMIRVGKKRKSKPQKVEVFKNEVSLGVFNSICELVRCSDELLGIKLSTPSSVRRVCSGKSDQYKGLTFKYINK